MVRGRRAARCAHLVVHRHARAIYIGSGIAYLIGGTIIGFVSKAEVLHWAIVGDVRPWQSVFLFIGIPGLLIALLATTIREPPRRGATAHLERVPIAIVFRYMVENARTFLSHNVGIALISLVNYGTAAWLPSFLMRTYGWTPVRAGVTLGILTMVFGTLGIVGGGRLADILRRRGYTDARVRVCIWSGIAQLISGVLYLTAP